MTSGRTSTGTSIRQRTGHGIRSLVLCALITACGSDESGTLVMRFEHRMEDQSLALGTPYTTRYGQELSFEHLRYWVSNVSLRRGDEHYDVTSSYYLIEQTPEQTRLTVEIKGIPAGSYDELDFHLGVDPAPNGSLDLMAGELAPGVGMDWSWDTGYKFLRTEGTFEERGVAGRFVIHTGNDVLYKRLTGQFAAPVEIITGARTTVRLQADVDRLFAGIELGKTAEILGGTVDSLAGKVAGSYARMFTMITAAGSVRMTGSSPNLGGNTGSGDIPADGTPPALSAAIIDLPGTQATTALWCDPVPARPAAGERACVTPFLLGTGGAYQDAGLFTFVTDNDAPVRAAAPGIVAEVMFLDHSAITHSDLFLVVIRDSDDAAFRTEYHNLKNLEVERGDEVEAGQVLGGAGDHFDPAVGIVSFGVARHQEVIQRLCPTRYATPELTAAYDGALATSNAAWPGIVHDGLCQAPALVCSGAGACTAPGDYTVAQGDIDAGRRLYRGSCASCHGDDGEGNIGPPLCFGPGCTCRDCVDHATLAARIEADMPPEGYCNPECAANVAAFIVHEFALR